MIPNLENIYIQILNFAKLEAKFMPPYAGKLKKKDIYKAFLPPLPPQGFTEIIPS